MRRLLLIRVLFAVSLVGLGHTASAQRLLPMQSGIEGVGGIVLQPSGGKVFSSGDFSAQAAYVQYFRATNYLSVGADYEQRHYDYKAWRVPIQDVLLNVTYNHPLVSNLTKDFFLYAGAGVVAGYERVNNGEILFPNGATLLNRSRWVWGGTAQLSLEAFFCDWLVFVIRGQVRFLFNQQTYMVRPTIQSGFRINF